MFRKCFGLVLFASTLATFLPAQESTRYEIGGIALVGHQQAEEQAVISLSGLRVGNKIDIPGPATGAAIRALWKQQLFSDIEIIIQKAVGNVAFLQIRVRELPRLSSWTIRGLKKQELKEADNIARQQLQTGAPANEQARKQLQQALLAHWNEKGYFDTEIQIEETVSRDSSTVALAIKVDKGKRLKIARIRFEGNEVVSAGKLRRLMEARATRRLFGSAHYVASLYENSKQQLVRHYHSLGYRDAAIPKDSLWRDDKGRAHLLLEIDEGQPYYFGPISWEGNSTYPTAVLQKHLGIKPGDVYNAELLQERLFFSKNGRDISSLYMDNGHLFMQLEPVEKGIRGNQIGLEIRITEGPLATISEVDITGNSRTHDYVIRRAVRTQPGQPFSRAALIRSQRELMAMGYFNPEKLGVNTSVDPRDGTVALEYEVEEIRNEKLELSGGWNPSSKQIVGTVGITLDNFSLRNFLTGKNWSPLPSGDGQRLSFRLQSSGSQYQAANFSFSEPWLGGKRPNLFTVAGFYQRFTNGASSGEGDFSSLSVGGGSLQLGTRLRALRHSLAFTTELSVQHIYLNGYQDIRLDDGSEVSQGRFNNIYIKPALTFNTTGDPFFPRQGARITVSAQLTPPFSALGLADAADSNPYRWLEYHKWRFDAEWYHPISSRLVFKAAAKMGWLGHYNSAIGTPPFERFELGGSGISSTQAGFVGNDLISLRGYEEGYLPGSRNGGGGAFSKWTAELRYPVLNTPGARAFLLGFAEAGNIWKEARQFSPFKLRPSAGLGLRVQLPMFGTIGFDYGIGFDKPELQGEHWRKYGTFNIILGFEPE